MAGIVKEIFAGKVKTIGNDSEADPLLKKWTSGIFKQVVDGEIYLSKTNLANDQQADLVHHGGPEKALFAYPSEHYQKWKSNFPKAGIEYGGMGENLLLENMLEENVAIGDTYEVGSAIIQVSQPRQPCWKPARRFKTIDFALEIQQLGKTGWYYRVIREGYLEKGNTLKLIDRTYPQWTIKKCNEIMHKTSNIDDLEGLANCPLLASNWQNTLQNRLKTGEKENINRRIYGPNKSLS